MTLNDTLTCVDENECLTLCVFAGVTLNDTLTCVDDNECLTLCVCRHDVGRHADVRRRERVCDAVCLQA